MPQIYVIASKRGLELGFAVSISEAEYSDAKIKQQNRIIIPQIHRKLPISGTVIERLDAVVGNSPEWHVNASTRLLQDDDGFDAFQLPSDLFKSLKKEPLSRGGGAICRIFPASVFHEGKEVDLKLAFKEALEHFAEIQLSCAPSAPDRKFVIEQTKVAEFSEDEELWADQGDDADQINSDDVDTDQKFREVAVRQGQAKFRSNLIGLFDGKCAITGCAVAVALQAAHIVPYRKKSKLDLGNGLLLRADIHTLFDMFLLSVSPDDLTVHVSPQLEGTEYVALHGKKISLSHANRKGPSRAALRWHFEQLVSA
nr:HNH endonuclease [Thalassospira sp. ER-Se-21-Dark]